MIAQQEVFIPTKSADWSTYFSAMAHILSQLSITWSSLVFYSIALVLIIFLVSILIDKKYIKEVIPLTDSEQQVMRTQENQDFKQAINKVWESYFPTYVLLPTLF